jgi:hypothetical protein
MPVTPSGRSAGSRSGASDGWPVAETLSALRPSLPGFLSERALAWCENAALCVPASARSHYLECRPGQSDRIDLLSFFGAKRACDDYQQLLCPNASAEPGSVWDRNLSLLREWARPESPVAQAPCVWFEYDAPSAPNPLVLASPSVGLEQDYQQRHFAAKGGLSSFAASVSAQVLDVLLPAASAQVARQTLQRCFAALPPDGGVGYLSVMTARSPAAVKLYVILPRRSLGAYLQAVGWPGDIARATALLGQLYLPELSTAYLDLTLTSGVQARLGIAVSQFHRRELGSGATAAWPPLPEELSAVATELRAWTGTTRAVVGGSRTWIHRWLDLKAVLEGDQVEYKAYLGFAPTLPPPFE